MKQVSAAIMLLLLLSPLPFAYAETYSWTDERGTVHFTEDLGSVPKSMRNKVRVMDGANKASEEKPALKASGATPQAVEPGNNGANGSYSDKSLEGLKKELSDREAAMIAVRARTDEIAARLKEFSGEWDEQKKLLQEYNSASARLKEMRGEYFQQVERARKAGLVVNIQE